MSRRSFLGVIVCERRSAVARMEPPGPAGACHRAGQRPDPVGRPDDKLREMRELPAPDHAALHPGYEPGHRGSMGTLIGAQLVRPVSTQSWSARNCAIVLASQMPQ